MKRILSFSILIVMAAVLVFAGAGFVLSVDVDKCAVSASELNPGVIVDETDGDVGGDTGTEDGGEETPTLFESIMWSGAESLPYEITSKFVTMYADRTCGTDAANAAAEGLNTVLGGLGYEPAGDNGTAYQEFWYENHLKDKNEKDRNVVFLKKSASSTGERVILGAHYDNLTNHEVNGKILGGDGTIDNGTGIGTLLAIAYELKDVELPFDVYFVLFGAEQLGFFGSAHFLNKLSADEKASVLMMFDFNMVGGGDFLYLYCDEVKTEHSTFIAEKAAAAGAELKLPPRNKEVVEIVDTVLPYTHVGLESDCLVFLAEKIPVAHFFGYNWDIKNTVSGKEFADRANVVGTASDNLSFFDEFVKAGGIKKMDDTVKITLAVLTDENFAATAKSSRENVYDYSVLTSTKYIAIITACVLAAMTGIVVLVFFLLKRKDAPYTPPAPGDTSQGIPFDAFAPRREGKFAPPPDGGSGSQGGYGTGGYGGDPFGGLGGGNPQGGQSGDSSDPFGGLGGTPSDPFGGGSSGTAGPFDEFN